MDQAGSLLGGSAGQVWCARSTSPPYTCLGPQYPALVRTRAIGRPHQCVGAVSDIVDLQSFVRLVGRHQTGLFGYWGLSALVVSGPVLARFCLVILWKRM